MGARLYIIAQRLFKYADIDPRVGFRYADAFTEQTDAGRREPAPAQTGERRQARVVPAINVLRLHQLRQLRLLITVWLKFRRANSICCGSGRLKTPASASDSRIQSYSGR